MEQLSNKEILRYSRHLKLPSFGIHAQRKLKQSKVLLIGAGGLGCPIGLYLAAAGVGAMVLVDDDVVEVHNLQRQVAHGTAGAGSPKVDSLRKRLHDLNPHVQLTTHQRRLNADWIMDVIADCDLVIDGTDNFATRYLVADACHLAKKPLVYGAIYQFEGQVSLFVPGEPGGCYRCLFPEAPSAGAAPSCDEAGVLGILPGTIGLMMANEAVKFLCDLGETLSGYLLMYDALAPSMRRLKLNRDPACALCGDQPTITRAETAAAGCAIQPPALEVPEISVAEAHQAGNQGAVFLDVRGVHEFDICHVRGAELIPLPTLDAESAGKLNRENQLIVYCHKGVRSRKATARLQALGFENVVSMRGGIDAWAEHIEPEMARY
ncbi:molybdopterin-synthase adenylyltransferase MoeB [Acanthopleuribacter pedis]|uniref:Molybdopterin-synthase adenylyltransferase n=1 Tax=Acanthopleuribacter pedis TaxID=442870 RepID=A0A8J7QAW0_9BACT|nr:molybdopterin-synthase adenylyltransferase MoeB [Acanthopleuribacter pedis]MBO1320709.1 molybdopterin-synthase adenylyltransferase MoeB [Acanthopleuribacter pedis]